MKALTLMQPWASLVVCGAKKIETRSWQTFYRGWLAIHAARGFPSAARELCLQSPFWSALEERGTQLPRGCVIAVARLVDCRPTGLEMAPAPWIEGLSEDELDFGDFSAGRYGWFLEDVRPFPGPIRAKGALGLWEWECSLARMEQVGLICPRAEAVLDRLQAAFDELELIP